MKVPPPSPKKKAFDFGDFEQNEEYIEYNIIL